MLEFHKFPKDVPDNEVEDKVIDILNGIKEEGDDDFTNIDFHACHRLKNRERVIVKLTSRKRMRAAINTRKKLANKDVQQSLQIGRLYMVESLAGPYKPLLFKCQQLKAAGCVFACWFFNGNINVQLVDKGTKEHISHQADILELLNITEDELNEIVNKKY